MEEKIFCPKCKGSEFWQTKDKRLKCKKCRFLFKPKENKFKISNALLKEIIRYFLLDYPQNFILQNLKISKYKLLKIINFIRKKIKESIPDILDKNISLINEPIDPKKNFLIGILSKEGKISIKILQIEPQEIESFLKEKLERVENWMKNFAFIYNSSFYKLTDEKNEEIEALENFWKYIRNKVFLRKGVKKTNFLLYLAQYLWFFNHQKLSLEEKEKIILNLILKNSTN